MPLSPNRMCEKLWTLPVDQLGSAAPPARPVWPIGHQAPRFDIEPVKVDRRQLCPQCQGIDLNSIGVIEGLTRNNQCIGATLELLEDIELARSSQPRACRGSSV